jgi:hypothetical protein
MTRPYQLQNVGCFSSLWLSSQENNETLNKTRVEGGSGRRIDPRQAKLSRRPLARSPARANLRPSLARSLLYFPCVLLISSVQTTSWGQIFALPIFACSIIQTDTIFAEEQSF